jgi:hypothetical protein
MQITATCNVAGVGPVSVATQIARCSIVLTSSTPHHHHPPLPFIPASSPLPQFKLGIVLSMVSIGLVKISEGEVATVTQSASTHSMSDEEIKWLEQNYALSSAIQTLSSDEDDDSAVVKRDPAWEKVPNTKYQPSVCPPGSFCPTGARSPILCPHGFFCPEGSVRPVHCTSGMFCPEGAVLLLLPSPSKPPHSPLQIITMATPRQNCINYGYAAPISYKQIHPLLLHPSHLIFFSFFVSRFQKSADLPQRTLLSCRICPNAEMPGPALLQSWC